MKETTLLRIALICSLVGLVILYFVSDNIEINERNIEKITMADKDEMVKVSGIITGVINSEKVTILKIMKPEEIMVVMFKSENQTMPFKQGNEVEIIGKVDEYEGKMEIIASKVRIIK